MNNSRDFISLNNKVDEEVTNLSFKPHISARLPGVEYPKTSVGHDLLHTLRESYEDRASPLSRPVTSTSLDYALWLEAGKHSHKASYAKSLDGRPPINYNIWRNYRHYYNGVHSHSARRNGAQSRLNEEAAFKYPIIIPAPSQLGENHLRRFFESNKKELFQNQSHFRMALIRADNDERMLRLLSLQTQQRNPPVPSGKISFSFDFHRHESIKNLDKSETSSNLDENNNGKPSTSSTVRARQNPPQNSLNVSPQQMAKSRFGSGKKFIMRDNHPSMEKLKFEQELKIAINFHRELKRAKEGYEKSLYARPR